MPKRTDISSILIIGAGPIVIGQACEFDYAGAKAVSGMSRYLAQAAITLRKIQSQEALDNFDIAIIDSSLTRTIQEQRIPFERHRDHFIIGTERFKVLSGLDYYRTILMNRKSEVWHPDSNRSELSAFEVYTAVQIEPPQPYNYSPDDATPDEYAEELGDRSVIGPSFSGSFQAKFDPEGLPGP